MKRPTSALILSLYFVFVSLSWMVYVLWMRPNAGPTSIFFPLLWVAANAVAGYYVFVGAYRDVPTFFGLMGVVASLFFVPFGVWVLSAGVDRLLADPSVDTVFVMLQDYFARSAILLFTNGVASWCVPFATLVPQKTAQ